MIAPHQTDFHVHPDYSIDAEGSIREYCEKAVSIGLKKICFTTHIDLDPRREEFDPFMRIDGEKRRIKPEILNLYQEEIQYEARRFAKRDLEVFCGIEIDYFEGVEEVWKNFNSGLEFDFIIGSVHCIDAIAFTWSKHAPSCFKRNDSRRFYEKYYKSVVGLARTGLFDCVGHLDGYRKYAAASIPGGLDDPPAELVESALAAIKEADIGIEINSAAIRHKVGQTYPSEALLRKAAEMEVPVVSLGSDAHSPDWLGVGLETSSKYIGEFGLIWRPRC
jgi:histidinol-phosphatase (PHP family)